MIDVVDDVDVDVDVEGLHMMSLNPLSINGGRENNSFLIVLPTHISQQTLRNHERNFLIRV